MIDFDVLGKRYSQHSAATGTVYVLAKISYVKIVACNVMLVGKVLKMPDKIK